MTTTTNTDTTPHVVDPRIVASGTGAMVYDAALPEAPAWDWFDREWWAARGALAAAGGGRGGVAFLDTPVGAGGQALSGGERRRLGLAGAYLRPAPWLVLDEPTEGLDFATEAQVLWRLQQRLARTGQGLLLVSHRPSPAALCEQVVGIEGVDGERRVRLAPRRNASQPSPLAMA